MRHFNGSGRIIATSRSLSRTDVARVPYVAGLIQVIWAGKQRQLMSEIAAGGSPVGGVLRDHGHLRAEAYSRTISEKSRSRKAFGRWAWVEIADFLSPKASRGTPASSAMRRGIGLS